MWITSKPLKVQDDSYNEDVVIVNQLYKDKDNTVYLAPRKLVTDNYTMPLGINKNKYDVRPSHFHDIGCRYHQMIVVDLPIETIKRKYLFKFKNTIFCRDIPKKFLKVITVTGNEVNDLFYRMMRDANIPKWICCLYRSGVSLNFGWFRTGKEKINLDKIYKEELET